MSAHLVIDDVVINRVIDILRQRGAVITFPQEAAKLLTVKEFRVAYTMLEAPTLSEWLARPDCPVFYAERGPTGRILRVRPTPELIGWLNERSRKGENADWSGATGPANAGPQGDRGGDQQTQSRGKVASV